MCRHDHPLGGRSQITNDRFLFNDKKRLFQLGCPHALYHINSYKGLKEMFLMMMTLLLACGVGSILRPLELRVNSTQDD